MSTFGLDLHRFHISDKYGFMLEDPLVNFVLSLKLVLLGIDIGHCQSL